VQRVATERPWPPLHQSQGSFISQEPAGGERVCGVEAWSEERCAARERGNPCRDEPAAHIYDEKTAIVCRCIIGDRMLPYRGYKVVVRGQASRCGYARHTSVWRLGHHPAWGEDTGSSNQQELKLCACMIDISNAI
jgi:hypothetical protein